MRVSIGAYVEYEINSHGINSQSYNGTPSSFFLGNTSANDDIYLALPVIVDSSSFSASLLGSIPTVPFGQKVKEKKKSNVL